ncbi:hypothetical protein Pcinc_043096, partial [Petrolisthes cinctipes]
YLLSASKDQTTRLHSQWVKDSDEKVHGWYEVGRPQVHGYDLTCLASIGSFGFVSGAEEKVIRGFKGPANFIRNFGRIGGMDVQQELAECSVGEGASVPSLGLSNKAIITTQQQQQQQQALEEEKEGHDYFKPLVLSGPPTEDELIQHTLWPEVCKLYGHGNEVMTIAATSDGKVLASACKANYYVDANIIIWDVTSWTKVDSLCYHRLTVTHLTFSHNDNYLLGVSRDRTWTLYKKHHLQSSVLGYSYQLCAQGSDKVTQHSRVIWKAAWSPDSTHFFTASRDKTVAVWGVGGVGVGVGVVVGAEKEHNTTTTRATSFWQQVWCVEVSKYISCTSEMKLLCLQTRC